MGNKTVSAQMDASRILQKRAGTQRGKNIVGSVLNGHRHGINGLLARDAFQSGENPTVLILIALHRKATFFVSVCPGKADKMFFGLCQG